MQPSLPTISPSMPTSSSTGDIRLPVILHPLCHSEPLSVILSEAKNLMQKYCVVLQILHSACGSVQEDNECPSERPFLSF